MRTSSVFFALFRFLFPPTAIGLIFIYLYPAIFGCGFAAVKPAEAACLIPGQERPAIPGEAAPFRLLALADPQIEGDTSLPDPDAPFLPSLARLYHEYHSSGLGHAWSLTGSTLYDTVAKDIPGVFAGYRKRLDLLGNDYYLAHVYRSVSWWTGPTHLVVLGDLLGSQWIDDEEFASRSRRFWSRVFKGTVQVPKNITGVSGRSEVLGADERWSRRLIGVAGNHDIGYAGDINRKRVERFERVFGDVNWDIRFRLSDDSGDTSTSRISGLPFTPAQQVPELHLVILNSMNLDEPAHDSQLRKESLDFLDDSLHERSSGQNGKTGTVLLTHIPMHKDAGICTDPPYFSHFGPGQGGGIKEQNHLSKQTSKRILDDLANRNGESNSIILNGHDHVGCQVHHYQQSAQLEHSVELVDNGKDANTSWVAMAPSYTQQLQASKDSQALREITVRSMMGSYGGNAGLLSAWYDKDDEQWKFEYDACPFIVQHVWWAVHGLAMFELGLGLAAVIALVKELMPERPVKDTEKKEK